MKNKKIFDNLAYYLLYATIILCGLYYARACSYWIIDDSLSYLSIARLYAQGQFWKAVNSHWSPMFSWLLALLKLIHADELYWGKMILVGSIIPSVYVFKKIGEELKINIALTFPLSVAVAIVLFHDAVANFTPDILFIPCLLYILLQFIKLVRGESGFNIAALGVVAATGFYIKQYTLFYFLLFYIALVIIFLFSSRRKIVFKNFLKSVTVFLLIIGPWVTAISIKSHRFTFSTATSYNISFLGNPEVNVSDYINHGLLNLPYPEAYSYWDAPARLPVKEISIFDAYNSKQHIHYQLSRMHENYYVFSDFIDFILNNHLPIIFFLTIITIIYHYWRHDSNSKYYLLVLLSILVYSSGYIFLVADFRYTYFDIIIFLLLAAMILNDVLRLYNSSSWLYFVTGVFIFYQLSSMSIQKTNDFYEAGIGKTERVKRISSRLIKDVNVCQYETDYQQADIIYENNFKNYGMLKSEQQLHFKLNEINKDSIHYILSSVAINDSMGNYLTAVINNDEELWIYEVKQAN